MKVQYYEKSIIKMKIIQLPLTQQLHVFVESEEHGDFIIDPEHFFGFEIHFPDKLLQLLLLLQEIIFVFLLIFLSVLYFLVLSLLRVPISDNT